MMVDSSGFAALVKCHTRMSPMGFLTLRLRDTCMTLRDRDPHAWHWVDHPGLCGRSHQGGCDHGCDMHSPGCLGISTMTMQSRAPPDY